MTRETADKYGLTSLADLQKQNGKLVVGAAPEVKKRQVGAVGLKEVYGVDFKEFRSLDSDGPLVKGALKKGDVDVANLFTTDTDIEANGWVVLADPKHLIPSPCRRPGSWRSARTSRTTPAISRARRPRRPRSGGRCPDRRSAASGR